MIAERGGNELASALRALGITQERIARGLPLDRSTVSRVLNGVGDAQWPLVRERVLALVEAELGRPDALPQRVVQLRKVRRQLLGNGLPTACIGREDLLRELADQRLCTGAPLLVCGPGGIGKTVLLGLLRAELEGKGWCVLRQELKQRHFTPMQTEQPFPRARYVASLDAACRNLSRSLGGSDDDRPAVEALVEALRTRRDDICLILDSVEEAPLATVAALLRCLAEELPGRENLLLVLVSRTQDLYTHGAVTGAPFVVGELDREAAQELWERRAGLERSGEFARAFAKTKGHPLALMLLADLLCRYGPARFQDALAFRGPAIEQLIEYEYRTVWSELSSAVQTAFLLWLSAPLNEELSWDEMVAAFSAAFRISEGVEAWIEELVGRHFLLPKPADPGKYYAHALAVNALRATEGFAHLAR